MAKIVETSDEWITTRTGIKARCVVENETTSDLAFHAAEMALKTANISAEELDMVILATITPDNTTPLPQQRFLRVWASDRAQLLLICRQPVPALYML